MERIAGKQKKPKLMMVSWGIYCPAIPEMRLCCEPTGAAIAIYDLAEGLSSTFDISLFLCAKPVQSRKLSDIRLLGTKDKYEAAQVSAITEPGMPEHIVRMQQVFESVLLAEKPDLVNFQVNGELENDCLEICLRHQIKCVVASHLYYGHHCDFPAKENWIREEDRLFSKRNVFFTTVSNGMKNKIRRDFPDMRDEQITAIPNGIKLLERTEAKTEADRTLVESVNDFARGRRILLCAGTITKYGRKNQLQLPRAFHFLPKEIQDDVVIIFCGSDNMQGKLQASIVEHGLTGSMEYIGLVPYKQMGILYSIVDGIISVSRAEGLSLVFLEAMSCGKSLIFFRDSECADDISDECCATFIDDISDVAVAQSITQWYLTKWNNKYIREYVAKNFSHENMMGKYKKLFHDMVGSEKMKHSSMVSDSEIIRRRS